MEWHIVVIRLAGLSDVFILPWEPAKQSGNVCPMSIDVFLSKLTICSALFC